VFHIKPININNIKTYRGLAFFKKYYNLKVMVCWDVATSILEELVNQTTQHLTAKDLLLTVNTVRTAIHEL
jgi:hypothetical protein